MLLERSPRKSYIHDAWRKYVNQFEEGIRNLPNRCNPDLNLSLLNAQIPVSPKTFISLVILFQNDGCHLLLPTNNNSNEIPLHVNIAEDHHLNPDDDVLRGFIIISNSGERLLIADLGKKNREEVIRDFNQVFKRYKISVAYFHSDSHLSSPKQRFENVHIGNFTGVFDAFRNELFPENEGCDCPITNTKWMRGRLLRIL